MVISFGTAGAAVAAYEHGDALRSAFAERLGGRPREPRVRLVQLGEQHGANLRVAASGRHQRLGRRPTYELPSVDQDIDQRRDRVRIERLDAVKRPRRPPPDTALGIAHRPAEGGRDVGVPRVKYPGRLHGGLSHRCVRISEPLEDGTLDGPGHLRVLQELRDHRSPYLNVVVLESALKSAARLVAGRVETDQGDGGQPSAGGLLVIDPVQAAGHYRRPDPLQRSRGQHPRGPAPLDCLVHRALHVPGAARRELPQCRSGHLPDSRFDVAQRLGQFRDRRAGRLAQDAQRARGRRPDRFRLIAECGNQQADIVGAELSNRRRLQLTGRQSIVNDHQDRRPVLHPHERAKGRDAAAPFGPEARDLLDIPLDPPALVGGHVARPVGVEHVFVHIQDRRDRGRGAGADGAQGLGGQVAVGVVVLDDRNERRHRVGGDRPEPWQNVKSRTPSRLVLKRLHQHRHNVRPEGNQRVCRRGANTAVRQRLHQGHGRGRRLEVAQSPRGFLAGVRGDASRQDNGKPPGRALDQLGVGRALRSCNFLGPHHGRDQENASAQKSPCAHCRLIVPVRRPTYGFVTIPIRWRRTTRSRSESRLSGSSSKLASLSSARW
jgi:hypothetical protein